MWMSSAKEILLFRRILLNPVTCRPFQRFVSLKGTFLENDVLFWLEVQRYKVGQVSAATRVFSENKISHLLKIFFFLA